ncbi:hypothetical protein EVAR_22715_1 [Eumeta japonica]|uniref:Uncharacterized protein n=1 Tax=Eumeta variegata TaxID=151549 RepID=A0A4C1US93_EUMVA|nr:hypothetical protein EVAR_22715_1 [Eumeta japonica]
MKKWPTRRELWPNEEATTQLATTHLATPLHYSDEAVTATLLASRSPRSSITYCTTTLRHAPPRARHPIRTSDYFDFPPSARDTQPRKDLTHYSFPSKTRTLKCIA